MVSLSNPERGPLFHQPLDPGYRTLWSGPRFIARKALVVDAGCFGASLQQRTAHRVDHRRWAADVKVGLSRGRYMPLDERLVDTPGGTIPCRARPRHAIDHVELWPVGREHVEERTKREVRRGIRVQQPDFRPSAPCGELAKHRAERGDADAAGDEHRGSTSSAVHEL